VSDPEALAAAAVAAGRRAGLDAVGIAPAQPFATARRILEERKAAGLHGGMHFTYGNPARATDPGAALPGASALVVGARSYLRRPPAEPPTEPHTAEPGDAAEPTGGAEPTGATQPPPAVPDPRRRPGPSTRPGAQRLRGPRALRTPHGRPAGRVARYAWEDHYGPLREALGAVAAVLEAAGYATRVLADSNHLVDREAAYRAGLGFYGKNANLLLPGRGSWFVLGAVLTDAPLPPTRPGPLRDGCGTCARCIPACPTGAIVAPGVIDARRCLAWVLEAPGPIPVALRPAVGDRIYGCDDCQEACPPNRTEARHRPPPPAGPGATPAVDLVEVLAADDDALDRRFARWYVPRRQGRYIRRNALVALGNTADGADPAVAAALARALADPDPLIREHAAWAAHRLGRDDLLGLLGGPAAGEGPAAGPAPAGAGRRGAQGR
jgi:epoxyqueuosine reductase